MRKQKVLYVIFFLSLPFFFTLFPSKLASATTNFNGRTTQFPISRTVVLGWSLNLFNNPISNTFSYTITADSNNPAGVSGAPTSAQIIFDAVVPSSSNPGVEYSRATANGVVDFNGISFSTPGTYYFQIAETGSSDSDYFPIDPNTTHRIKVEVVYCTNPPLYVPETDCLTPIVEQRAVTVNGDKSIATWSKQAQYTNVASLATVSGNLADKNKCFPYTITVPVGGKIHAGDQFYFMTVVGHDINTPSHCSPPGSNGYYTITAGQPLTYHLSYEDVGGGALPLGVDYIINAMAGDDDSYSVTVDGTDGPIQKNASGLRNLHDITDDLEAGTPTTNATFFVRSKEMPAFAGIFTNIWVYIALLVLIILSIYIVSKYSQKRSVLNVRRHRRYKK